MTRALYRLAMVWGVVVLMLVSSCQASPDGGRPTTTAKPDPSANDPCKTHPGCALLQASFTGDRPHIVSWNAPNGQRGQTRVDPYRDDDGRWRGLFQLAVTVSHGDPVSIAADPMYGTGLTIVAVYHLGKDLCDSLPGSNTVKGLATCNVTIP